MTITPNITPTRNAFYAWLDEDKKADFIRGEVVVHSPVFRRHWESLTRLQILIESFLNQNPIGVTAVEKALIQLQESDYEPDLCFWRKEIADLIDDDQLYNPPPDFVAEILSKSTEHFDRTDKMVDYAEAGILEYWIIDAKKQFIEQYFNVDGQYVLQEIWLTGVVESKAIAGFRLPVEALFDEKTYRTVQREMMRG